MDELDRAFALGLVTRREVDSGLASVDAGATARVRSICSRGHALGYVKRVRRGKAATAERETLRRASDAGVGPKVLCASDADLVWLAAVPGSDLGALAGGRPTLSEFADVCASWGAALAALHTQPVPSSGDPSARRPGLGEGAAYGEAEGERRDVARAYASHPALLRAVDLVTQHWSQRCWIHGRLSAEHVIVETSGSPRVRFVGFGHAGIGDPGWDLAACLSTIARLAEAASNPEHVRALTVLLTDTFLHSYRRAGGPGSVQPAMQAVYELDVAWRVAGGPDAAVPEVHERITAAVERARAFAARGRSVILAA